MPAMVICNKHIINLADFKLINDICALGHTRLEICFNSR